MNIDQQQCAPDRSPAPKWASVVNDTLIPMPERRVWAAVIRQQGGIHADRIIIRDHNSEHDPLIADDDIVDLATGNVFYSVPRCDAQEPRPKCPAPAKLAYVVNDRWEMVTRPTQTGKSLRDLFALNAEVELLRDRESPHDDVVGDADEASFEHGCVFRTQSAPRPDGVELIVNGRERIVREETQSYEQIVKLAFDRVDPRTIYTIVFKKGPPANRSGKMVAGDIVKITCGMIFNVTPTCKS